MTSQGLSVVNPFPLSALPECSLAGLRELEDSFRGFPRRAGAASRADTHIDAEPERGDGGGLAQGQQQQEQGRGQLHQVEEVVVCEEVGRQRFGVLGVGEELVIILTFLGRQESRGRRASETWSQGCASGLGGGARRGLGG